MGNRTPWLGFDPQQKGGWRHAGLRQQILQGRRQPSPARDCQNKKCPATAGYFYFVVCHMGNRTPWLGFDPQQKGGWTHAGLRQQILQGWRQPSPARDCQNKKRRLVRRFLFCCVSIFSALRAASIYWIATHRYACSQ